MIDLSKIPLSPIVEAQGFWFLSGQLGFVSPGVLVEGGVAEQTRQAMANIETILHKNGGSLSDIVKTTVWLADKADFTAFNEAYAHCFDGGEFPARSTVVSQLLVDGALVEIEVVARRR